MQKKLLFIFISLLGVFCYSQTCPRLEEPANNAIGVPVDAIIRWNTTSGVEGYLISLGTTEGGTDILNRRSAGPVNSYQPDVGLPDDTLIYATISIFLAGGGFIDCPSEVFSTEDVLTPPPCTLLLMGSEENPNYVIGTLNWAYARSATGYRIRAGTTPGANDLIDNVEVGNVLSYRPLEELPRDQEIYVTITPFNENGDSVPCSEQQVIITEPKLDCTPFKPAYEIPDKVGICATETLATLELGNIMASGYRWYKIASDNTEIFISESIGFIPDEIGDYRFEAYNTLNQNGNAVECTYVKEFEVVNSETPIIQGVDIERQPSGLQITIRMGGIGNYEYAIGSERGPYQDSPVFQNLRNERQIIFARDKNGCGLAERSIELELSEQNFPRFFTPNQDGINDFWQFIPSPNNLEINVEYIRIYTRYGQLVQQLNPKSKGWDGTYNGRKLPASDYWFAAVSFNGEEIKGHFTLKR